MMVKCLQSQLNPFRKEKLYMKKTLKYLLSIVLPIFGLIMILTVKTSMANAQVEKEEVTILFTHDIHSNFKPYKAEVDGELKEIGGLARLQTIINGYRESEDNLVLLDAGDYSMGTTFQTIFASVSPELRIMGQMGYDAVTLGNHEFDYRAEGLADSLHVAKDSGEALPEMLISNAVFPKDDQGELSPTLKKLQDSFEYYGVKDYIVINRNGLRIGVFAIMGEESASMAPMSEVVFEDQVGHAQRVVKILDEEEKVDLIVCLSHSGTKEDKSESEDEILAEKVGDIDLIISGHTHTKLEEPILVGKTIIGSAEKYGNYLGLVKLYRQSDGWELDEYSLIPVDDRVDEDEEISGRIDEFEHMVEEEYFSKFNLKVDEVIARAPLSFPSSTYMSDHHEEAILGNLISDAYRYAVKRAEGDNYIPVDAAVVPVGTVRNSFYQGDIRTADAFSVSSLGVGKDKLSGYPLLSVYLTGKELKAVCEVDASVTPIMDEAQLYISGLRYSFNPNRLIFNKVTESSLVRYGEPIWAGQGLVEEEIADEKLYRVVAGLYSAQMLSVVGDKTFGLLKIEPKDSNGQPITNYEDHIIYNTADGSGSEVKEWYAIVSYLQSFDEEDGIPTIPTYYYETQGRKIVDNSKSIGSLISRPNKIAFMIYGIVLVILAIIILISRIIIRKIIGLLKR